MIAKTEIDRLRALAVAAKDSWSVKWADHVLAMEQYRRETGPLTVEALLDALEDAQREVAALRGAIEGDLEGHSHKCKSCGVCYTPAEGVTEDCPMCGSNGTIDAAMKGTP